MTFETQFSMTPAEELRRGRTRDLSFVLPTCIDRSAAAGRLPLRRAPAREPSPRSAHPTPYLRPRATLQTNMTFEMRCPRLTAQKHGAHILLGNSLTLRRHSPARRSTGLVDTRTLGAEHARDALVRDNVAVFLRARARPRVLTDPRLSGPLRAEQQPRPRQ